MSVVVCWTLTRLLVTRIEGNVLRLTYTMGLHKTNGNLQVMERENSVIKEEEDHEKNYKGNQKVADVSH